MLGMKERYIEIDSDDCPMHISLLLIVLL